MELNTQEKLKNGYDSLLLSYAAGTLDAAQNLAVESHLTFCHDARNFVQECECIGGTLLENECGKMEMGKDSLNNVLAQLNDPSNEKPTKCAEFQCETIPFNLPDPLQNRLSQQESAGWKSLMPGFKAYEINLECKQSTARFLKAAPGIKSPHHSHGGMEITLVLDGAFSDETGEYKTGDLIVTDDTVTHAPIACKMHGCTCLVVSSAAIKLTGIASLLNPFIKP